MVPSDVRLQGLAGLRGVSTTLQMKYLILIVTSQFVHKVKQLISKLFLNQFMLFENNLQHTNTVKTSDFYSFGLFK